jgi:hypothetical protein
MNGMLAQRVIALCILSAALLLLAACTPKVTAPRIPVIKYGEGAPFGPETSAAPIREIPEEIKPSEIIK